MAFEAARQLWNRWEKKNPHLTRFLVFFLLSNGITVVQLILMPLLKVAFDATGWTTVSFQWGQVARNPNGTPYYIFDYPAGPLAHGGGGGLSYFLAIQLTLFLAQVINFFAQRNVTFRSKVPVGQAALWYLLAYVLITLGAAVLQGFYKTPVYGWCVGVWGPAGETVADVVTMLINATLSFWVYYPILHSIFRPTSPKVASPEKDQA